MDVGGVFKRHSRKAAVMGDGLFEFAIIRFKCITKNSVRGGPDGCQRVCGGPGYHCWVVGGPDSRQRKGGDPDSLQRIGDGPDYHQSVSGGQDLFQSVGVPTIVSRLPTVSLGRSRSAHSWNLRV